MEVAGPTPSEVALSKDVSADVLRHDRALRQVLTGAIETADELSALLKLTIQLGQGYVRGRPQLRRA